jgi:hypothetical protein
LVLGCSSGSRSAGENDFETWLGPETAAVAGLQLDQVRAGPLNQAVPPSWLGAFDVFRQATRVWLAYSGQDLLVIAAGHFSPTPPGALLVHNGLALAGSANAIREAQEQYATGRKAGGRLLQKAEQLRNEPIWAVIRGDAPLPLQGNSANLERALRFTEYTAASVQWASGAQVRFTGYCATAEKARELEESLRAMVTLGKRAVRAGNLERTLESIRIDRHESTVLLSLSAEPEVLREVFR